MLNPKDNILLTQTGRGTPMGELLREYWWPVLRADKLERDGAPERVRLLGEDYVAFRATDGRLGFLDEHCPHRRVSLALARNEGCGLRCIMHGWKIDVSGKVVETPNEVEGEARLDRIKVRSFPVREAGGIVWVYVGQKTPPPFPNFAFNDAVTIEPQIATVNCNWIQVLETSWDPAHVQVLHAQDSAFTRTWETTSTSFGKAENELRLAISDIEVSDQNYGFRFRFPLIPIMKHADVGWILHVMPCWVFINGADSADPVVDRLVFAHTPIDDEHTLMWEIPFNLTREFGDFGRVTAAPALAGGVVKHDFRLPEMRPEIMWGQNRHAMAHEGSFTGLGTGRGIIGILNQDIAVAESMGVIVDREQEHVGPADRAVIKGRQVFLQAMRDHAAGKPALGANADVSMIGRVKAEEIITGDVRAEELVTE